MVIKIDKTQENFLECFAKETRREKRAKSLYKFFTGKTLTREAYTQNRYNNILSELNIKRV